MTEIKSLVLQKYNAKYRKLKTEIKDDVEDKLIFKALYEHEGDEEKAMKMIRTVSLKKSKT